MSSYPFELVGIGNLRSSPAKSVNGLNVKHRSMIENKQLDHLLRLLEFSVT